MAKYKTVIDKGPFGHNIHLYRRFLWIYWPIAAVYQNYFDYDKAREQARTWSIFFDIPEERVITK